jgi:hypothetical protein
MTVFSAHLLLFKFVNLPEAMCEIRIFINCSINFENW